MIVLVFVVYSSLNRDNHTHAIDRSIQMSRLDAVHYGTSIKQNGTNKSLQAHPNNAT